MADRGDEFLTTPEGDSRDLGFGAVVGRDRKRLLNRDGTFNVRRVGLRFWRSLSLYHTLLTMSWVRFFIVIAAAYVLCNLVFAAAYYLCGPDALFSRNTANSMDRFTRAFFFSVQTFGTIGYGSIAPQTVAANILVVIESLVSLIVFALATGLVYARFSRPLASIVFSRQAVIAPFKGSQAFMFRIANPRSNELIEVGAKVVVSMFSQVEALDTRGFTTLRLERAKVAFLPLTWTIVHDIDSSSPLWGLSREDYFRNDVEFLVLLTGIDETFAQNVHARMSYTPEEIVWGHRFVDLFGRSGAEELTVDISRIDEIEPAVSA